MVDIGIYNAALMITAGQYADRRQGVHLRPLGRVDRVLDRLRADGRHRPRAVHHPRPVRARVLRHGAVLLHRPRHEPRRRLDCEPRGRRAAATPSRCCSPSSSARSASSRAASARSSPCRPPTSRLRSSTAAPPTRSPRRSVSVMPGGDCLFCAVVAGSEPGHVVLDEPDVVAFLDHRPVFKGHVLVVPRVHVVTLPELPADLLAPLFGAVAALLHRGGRRARRAGLVGRGEQRREPGRARTCTCTSCPAPRATVCAASSGPARSTTARPRWPSTPTRLRAALPP